MGTYGIGAEGGVVARGHTLLDCPFCQGTQDDEVALCQYTNKEANDGWEYQVRCVGCGARGPDSFHVEAVVSGWNSAVRVPS